MKNLDTESLRDEETGLVIDIGIPFPEDTRSSTRYPFAKMNVGDSIFIPLKEGDNANRLKNRLSQASRTFGIKQEPEQKFILRYRLENETSGVRIWRKE